jgi:hypothetical protein
VAVTVRPAGVEAVSESQIIRVTANQAPVARVPADVTAQLKSVDASKCGAAWRAALSSLSYTRTRARRFNSAVYEYSFWSSPGQKYTLEPALSGAAAESTSRPAAAAGGVTVLAPPLRSARRFVCLRAGLLFYPKSREIQVPRSDCPPAGPLFAARPGSFIEGRLSPAVAGVSILVYSLGAAPAGSALQASHVKAADVQASQPVLTVRVHAGGHARAPPL